MGQNILDALEYPEFNRRNLVHITGTNSLALTPNIFRCDECYIVPPTASDEYPGKIIEIIKTVNPDLILSARDADTVALKKLKNEDESLPGILPYGSLESVNFALDKWESFLFCENHQLPFAETIKKLKSGKRDDLTTFVEKAGYPIIAKPAKGFASKGVYFIRNWSEAVQFYEQEDYILQEYLGKRKDIDPYLRSLDGPKPLFTETPNISHHTCHIPISPGGDIHEIFVLENHHNFGAVTKLQRRDYPELVNLATRFAEAFIAEGGYGPLSVQFRPDKHGEQKAQEMNLRTTGSTYPRLMMGQDELGIIINWALPDFNFPVYRRTTPGYDSIILKTLYSFKVNEKDVTNLNDDGYWESDQV